MIGSHHRLPCLAFLVERSLLLRPNHVANCLSGVDDWFMYLLREVGKRRDRMPSKPTSRNFYRLTVCTSQQNAVLGTLLGILVPEVLLGE
jgi:hypothetical protein